MGGEVPSSYYFNTKVDTTNKIALEIRSRRKERVKLNVVKPRAKLRQSFKKKLENIGVYYRHVALHSLGGNSNPKMAT